MRSKAHWGYDRDFMARVRPVLTVTPDMIAAGQVTVLEVGGRAAGFTILSLGDDATAELDMLFVEPARLGAGFGAQLFAHACDAAKAAGARRLVVESDPNACGFYERMGMTETGWRVSPIDPDRRLPVLACDLA